MQTPDRNEVPAMLSRRSVWHAVVAALLLAVTISPAQQPKGKSAPKDGPKGVPALAAGPTLGAAHGTVGKVDKDSVTVKPRGAGGRFEKELTLQVTGTSRVTQLSVQMRAGKAVAVQQDADVKA